MTHPIPPAPASRFSVATPEVRWAGAAMAEIATEVRRIRPHLDLEGIVAPAAPGP